MKVATIANSRPRTAGAQPNRKPAAVKKNKTHSPGKAKTAQNKSTAIARRPNIGPKAVQAIERNARAAQMASLKAAGKIIANKKKGKKKKRNSSRSGLMSFLPSMRNGGFRDVIPTLKAGGFGLLGGGASAIVAAALLAILDRIAPSWSMHKYSQSVATLVAAIVVLPLILSIKIISFAEATKSAMVTGGVIFGFGQGFSQLTEREDVFGDIAGQIRTGAKNLLQTGDPAADAAAKAVIARGGTTEEATRAAAGTLAGLRMRPRGSNGGGSRISQIGSVSRF